MLGRKKWPIKIMIRELRSGGKWETIEDLGRRYEDEGIWFLKFKAYKIDKTQVRNEYIEKTSKGSHFAYFFSTSKGNLIQIPPFSTGNLITSKEEKMEMQGKLNDLPIVDTAFYSENIESANEEIKRIEGDEELNEKEKTKAKDHLTKGLVKLKAGLDAVKKLPAEEIAEIKEQRNEYMELLDVKNLVFLPRVSTEDEREIVNNAAKRERRWNQKRGFWDKYGSLIGIFVTGIAMTIILFASIQQITYFWVEMGKQTLPALQQITAAMNQNTEVMREFMQAFGKEGASGVVKPPS